MDVIVDLPHTITGAILYNNRIESFGQLPKEKRPPRYMWDRPYELGQYLEHIWDKDGDKSKDNFEINFDDAE